jgi:heparanase
MNRSKSIVLFAGVAAGLWTGAACAGQGNEKPPAVAPTTMPRVGTVDERFQSYNIEMVEVTGGRFWKPFDKSTGASSTPAQQPASNPEAARPGGPDPSLYQYRPPIDLSNARLRKLAAALGPAYVRVSGTWRNSTFFEDSGGPVGEQKPATPPKGFNSVLTRKEWKGVVDFSRAVNAEIVTSFAISAGTRDADGVWLPDQARRFLAYTKSIGGGIAAAEFMNEPTFAEIGGAPHGYDAKAFARDFAIFHSLAKSDAPGMKILGPGGVGEGTALVPAFMHVITSEAIFSATGPVFDAVSYHSYGGVSSRCGAMGAAAATTEGAALTEDWLSRGERSEVYYAALRDRFEPGKPLWNTETAQAACGGDRWASTFLDTFRYLNQLGSLARRGVQVQMHNTLAASDYGLLDEKTYEPRPNYWAALLWHRLMGTTVLDPGPSPAPPLHLYAHCMRGTPGGVVMLAINADKAASHSIESRNRGEIYILTARELLASHVELNGKVLDLDDDDNLPLLEGEPQPAGQITLAPASIAFVAFPKARNASCH